MPSRKSVIPCIRTINPVFLWLEPAKRAFVRTGFKARQIDQMHKQDHNPESSKDQHQTPRDAPGFEIVPRQSCAPIGNNAKRQHPDKSGKGEIEIEHRAAI